MIKIETKDGKDGYSLEVIIEGKGEKVANQIASALNEIAERSEECEELVAIALAMYLEKRGFKG